MTKPGELDELDVSSWTFMISEDLPKKEHKVVLAFGARLRGMVGDDHKFLNRSQMEEMTATWVSVVGGLLLHEPELNGSASAMALINMTVLLRSLPLADEV